MDQPPRDLAPGARAAASVNVASYLVGYLRRCGIDRAYCVPGESYLPVLDAFIDSGIDLITCYHESSAGFMAVADGRLTGKPGIFLVSRGPGATNAAIALHTAQQDGVPVILFVGQVPRRNLRREAFQEIDYGKMYGSVCKWVVEVSDPDRMPEALARAMHVSMDATPGPVVIVLPEDMLEEWVAAPADRPDVPALTAPSPAAVRQAADLLNAAERPLILAGGALAIDRGRAALRRVAEALHAPVMVSFRRHDLMSNSHLLFGGDIGLFITPSQMQDLAQADVILAVGTRLGDLSTNGFTFPAAPWPEQPLIHVYNDAAVIGTNHQPTVAAVCRPEEFLEALADHLRPAATRDAWVGTVTAHQRRSAAWTRRTASDGVVFGNVIQALQRIMPSDAIVATDAGMSAALMYRHFCYEPPQRLLATVTGCMGFGVPGAIAFALRSGGRRVVALLGDGGFLMTANELAIAVERKLPIVFLLANNRSLGSIRANQERLFPGRKSATDLSPPDFALLAQAHGCAAISVGSEDGVADALDRAFAHTAGPILVEFRTSLSAALGKGPQIAP